MKSIHASLLVFASLPLAASCNSTRTDYQRWEPLVIQERVELDYEGQLGLGGFADATSALADPTQSGDARPTPTSLSKPGSTKTPTEKKAADGGAPTGPFTVATITVVEMPVPLGRRLLGLDQADTDAQSGARSTPIFAHDAGLTDADAATARIDALVKAGDATLVDSTKLSSLLGQKVSYSVLNQTAYVKGFAYESQKAAFIADPVVDIADSGMRCILTTQKGETGELQLELDLQRVHLVRPIPLFTTRTNAFNQVTIQTPVYRRIRLSGKTELPKGKLLYLALPSEQVLAGEDGRMLLTLIRVSR